MSDIIRIFSADLLEKPACFMIGGRVKVEAILRVEYQAGFAVDSLARAEKAWGDAVMCLREKIHRINYPLVQ